MTAAKAPLDAAVPIAATPVRAFVAIGAERGGELLGQGKVQRLANVAAKLRFDVLAKLKDRGGACAS